MLDLAPAPEIHTQALRHCAQIGPRLAGMAEARRSWRHDQAQEGVVSKIRHIGCVPEAAAQPCLEPAVVRLVRRTQFAMLDVFNGGHGTAAKSSKMAG